MQFGAQKRIREPPFFRDKTRGKEVHSRERRQNPEERVKMRGDQKVPDGLKVKDRKPGVWIIGARLAGQRADPGPSLELLLALPPFLAQAPSQLLPGRYLSWLWLYSVLVSDK